MASDIRGLEFGNLEGSFFWFTHVCYFDDLYLYSMDQVEEVPLGKGGIHVTGVCRSWQHHAAL